MVLSLTQALKFERQRDATTVGAGVFSTGGIHERLRSFVSEWRMRGRPKVFTVSVDVRRCYDTMKQVSCACVRLAVSDATPGRCARQDKLLAIVEPLLLETEYLVQRYHEVSAVGTTVRRRMRRKVMRPCDAVPFADFARELASTRAGLVRAGRATAYRSVMLFCAATLRRCGAHAAVPRARSCAAACAHL